MFLTLSPCLVPGSLCGKTAQSLSPSAARATCFLGSLLPFRSLPTEAGLDFDGGNLRCHSFRLLPGHGSWVAVPFSLWLRLIPAACLNAHPQPVLVGAGFPWPGAEPAWAAPVSGSWSGRPVPSVLSVLFPLTFSPFPCFPLLPCS